MTTDIFVSSGVTSNGLLIQPGDNEIVLAGGSATNTTVDGVSATLTVSSGGVANFSFLENFGVMDLGGTASGVTVDADSVMVVDGTATGVIVNSAGLEQVGSGANVSGSVVNAAGEETIGSGAIVTSETLSGGLQFIDGGGTVSDTIVDQGGAQNVGSANAVTGTTVNSGGRQQVGGTAIFNYYYGGTSQTDDLSGGIVSNTTVSAGGLEAVSSGGTAIGTSDYGEIALVSGGATTGTTVQSGGVDIANGGSNVSMVVERGGLAQEGGEAVDSSTVVSGGGVEWVYTSATASGSTLSGGTQIIGGITSSTVYGVQSSTGGSTVATIISSGGGEFVGTGATTTGTVVNSGGVQQVGGSTVWAYQYGQSAGTSVTMSTNLSGGVASFTSVSSGGTETIDAGGTTSNTVILNGGTQIVSSGGVASGTTVNSGSFLVISSGGSAAATIVQSGGTATVSSGGVFSGGTIFDGSLTVSGTTVTGGGLIIDGGTAVGVTASGALPASDTGASVIYVTSGGVTSDSVLESARELVVGATATGTIVSSGGEEDVQSGGSTTNDVVSSGGLEALLAGGVASGTTIDAGGTTVVFSGSTASNTTITNGGTLVVLSGGSAPDMILQTGGTIDVGYVPYVSGATASLDSSTDILTVTDGANTLTYQMADSYTGRTFLVANDSANATQITLTPCFRTGTHILTDRGEVPVERLAIGDRVATTGGTLRPIKWIGHRRIDFTRHPEPELAQPILIRTNAMADGAPHRDLSVSPDHALLLDDVLVPARLLVNGASIRRDHACRAVTYYHVELDAHDILLAENLAAESYLDTGNRAMFENSGTPMLLHPDLGNEQTRRVIQSCRPFADDPAVVEPIWRRLASRASQLGMPLAVAVETTGNPDLRVVIDGRTVKPVCVHGERYSFVLPPVCSAIHLVSRSARPCDIRPWVEDRRQLGVMICRLTVMRGSEMAEIPLDHPQMTSGWWAAERDQATLWRWTNGDAVVPASGDGAAVLEVTVRETLDYPADGQAIAVSVAPATAA